MSLRLALVCFALGACAAPAAPPSPPASQPAIAAEAAVPTPPDGIRLPRGASPVRYTATLTVVPAKDTLQGEIDIDVALAAPTDVLWLNATEISVRDAHLEAGGRRIPARPVPGGPSLLGFALAAPAPAGAARLHVAYEAKISSSSDRGLFQEDEQGAFYIYTQFEHTDARRAFPCFDEPSFKVPWQLTLRIKEGDVALSNSPVVSETPAGDGMKVVRFAETQPLPSYLVAFAVGPFSLVDLGKVGAKGTPVRLAVPKGRQADTAFARAATPAILTQIEDYFGTPYPYEKLDVVTIPRLATYGAMENAGLITMFQRGVLAKPHEDTIAHQRRYSVYMTHEIAHQWFGDLVTLAWWDDLWLNEAFASWMENKIVAQWKPEWVWDPERVDVATRAMVNDSFVSARKVRQSVASYDDIENAFDGITYDKGASVLMMFESWIGPDRFRKGLQRYFGKHAHGTATSSDFLAAMSAEAGRDITAAFSTFLDQPGVPLVNAALTCDKGSAPRVELTQERYLPAGSLGATAAQTWHLPVCVRWDGGRACTLLTDRATSLDLGLGTNTPAGCPKWLMPNEGGNGYYHVAYPSGELQKLLRVSGRQLTVAERLTVLRDARAMVNSGKLPAAEALAILPEMARDPSPSILRSAVTLVLGLPSAVVPDGLRPNLARFVQKTFGPRARALGWLPKPGEDEQLRLLRPFLVRLVADVGDDKALVAEAASLTARWLDEPGKLAPDVVGPILRVAANHGDRRLFDRIYADARRERDLNRRGQLLGAMRSFRDPGIVNDALSIVLKDEFDLREAIDLLVQDEHMAEVVFAFYRQNFDALMAKLPASMQSDTLYVASLLCGASGRADVEAFFKSRSDKLPGGPHTMAQVIERISLCSALRDTQGESLAAFLKKY